MRKSGILLPLSSVPSPYGFGSAGQSAIDFIDFLKTAGQTCWQVLPIGPIGYADSPYQSFSTFAVNPYYIDLDLLVAQGLLTCDEICAYDWGDSANYADYGLLYQNRFPLLRLAASRLDPQSDDFQTFLSQEADWIEDYALFMAIKVSLQMVGLREWPAELRQRDVSALKRIQSELAPEIIFWQQLQYMAFRHWQSVKAYANAQGISIIGDVPIYVSPDSSDLWAQPELFQTDGHMNLVDVAGCPPDFFAPLGQLWGNPLYDWPQHQQTKYQWWLRRLRHAGRIYDVVRIDHFRGFESYYAIPSQDKTAENGCWKPGPDYDFIQAVLRELPDLAIIAEDLGVITAGVKELLARSGYPGMKVLQFAFGDRSGNDYLPYNYDHNCVVYTGTHDNTTTADWLRTASPDEIAFAREYL
ncbi:MAG TPA: 4-alpha-glucanotransferase, partial [Clostridiales bacterium]|nr:4-alpha-glucanotransferase [Clostridiales bacterium]